MPQNSNRFRQFEVPTVRMNGLATSATGTQRTIREALIVTKPRAGGALIVTIPRARFATFARVARLAIFRAHMIAGATVEMAPHFPRSSRGQSFALIHKDVRKPRHRHCFLTARPQPYAGSPVEIVSHFWASFAGSVLPFTTLMHRRPTIMNDGGGVPTVRFKCLIPRSAPFPARAFRVRGVSLK